MENNNFWWYVIPFCLGVASLTLTLYGYHERTSSEQAIEEPVKVTKYDVYKQFEEPLLAEGWQVIVFIPSKEEDSDRITCGNALLSVKE